ncbi:MAG: hypothetical protein ACREK1_11950, partial [Longimicrobiales bacterium]
EMVGRATEMLRSSPGPSPIYVTVSHGSRNGGAAVAGEAGDRAAGNGMLETVRLRSRSITVTPSEKLLNDLRELFGSDRIRLVRS